VKDSSFIWTLNCNTWLGKLCVMVLCRIWGSHIGGYEVCLPPASYWFLAWLTLWPWRWGEGGHSSETSVDFHRTTWRYIPAYRSLCNNISYTSIANLSVKGNWNYTEFNILKHSYICQVYLAVSLYRALVQSDRWNTDWTLFWNTIPPQAQNILLS
jgi:hypothetical protein